MFLTVLDYLMFSTVLHPPSGAPFLLGGVNAKDVFSDGLNCCKCCMGLIKNNSSINEQASGAGGEEGQNIKHTE